MSLNAISVLSLTRIFLIQKERTEHALALNEPDTQESQKLRAQALEFQLSEKFHTDETVTGFCNPTPAVYR